MANASADNLIKRILSEARDTAAHILAEAEKQCNDIRSEQEKRIAQNAESLSKTRAIQVKEILDGAETRARLEGQKEALADKRDLLDKAFASAYEALCNQSSEELSQLFASVLKKEAEKGDMVFAAEKDKATVEKAVKMSGADVIMADECASCERGFILRGKSYEKNCSLKAVLDVLRDSEETKVAEILFSKQ